MATVNKNFKIKNGLVVEGTTATVNGNQILTESASDQYIIDLIGGETLVTSVESAQMEVIAGELNIKSGVFDVSGAAAAAQTAAASDATTKANAAQVAAEATASADATSKAATAKSEAISAAATDATTKANAAQSAAASDATTKADAAQAAAALDATSKANAARTGADAYTDSAIGTEVTARNAAITTAINTEVSDRNNAIATAKGQAIDAAETYADNAVSALVGSAPELLDTLQELATALDNNPDIISDLQGVAAGKQNTLTEGANIDITADTISVTGLTTADVAEDTILGGAYFTNQRAVDATAGVYDPAGSADAAALSAAGDLSDHESATVAHGATGAVVGTTNAQTLTNKTIGDTLNFVGAGAMTINSDSDIVLTPAAGSDVKWGADVLATENYVDSEINALSTSDIEEGTNLYFTNARAISAVGGTIGDAIDLLDTDDVEEGVENLYFTNARALSATASAYDVAGAAAAAQGAAEDYADGLAVNYDSAGSATAAYSDAVAAAALDASTKANNAKSGAEATASADATTKANAAQAAAEATAALDATSKANAAVTTAAADATTKANAAQSAAEATAAGALSTAISTEVTNRNSAIATAKTEAISDANDYTDGKVSDLIGSAPAVLDTLQELAAALENNPDIIADLESVAAGKQDTLIAGSNIDITGSTISVTGLDAADISDFNAAALTATALVYDPAGSAADAESNANTFATGEAEAAEAAAIAAAALDATEKADAAGVASNSYTDGQIANLTTGVNGFELLNLNDESAHFAAASSSLATVAVTTYEFDKSDYRSAKLMVKIDNGTDNEVSEILLTLDASDNIAITEYAIVGTNGSRGSITADISGSNVRVRVTPVNNSTVKITGTLLK